MKELYPNPTWRQKVERMSDQQVHQIYVKQVKNKEKEEKKDG